MITTAKWLGVLAVAFVAGSFVASPELRAYAANTIASGDIIDGEVKTADLASNAVTAMAAQETFCYGQVARALDLAGNC